VENACLRLIEFKKNRVLVGFRSKETLFLCTGEMRRSSFMGGFLRNAGLGSAHFIEYVIYVNDLLSSSTNSVYLAISLYLSLVYDFFVIG